MGIRHSKKSHDIQSSPKKNGSTAETEVKIKELPEDGAPVKQEEVKEGETIEEVAEKTAAAPNGDATAEQTQVEVSTVVLSVCGGEGRALVMVGELGGARGGVSGVPWWP